MNKRLRFIFFLLAVLILPGLCQASVTILTNSNPNHTITSGSDEKVYGTSASNQITLESGAKAELINFQGQNVIKIWAASDGFTLSRSGTIVTFQDSNGTLLKIPATQAAQIIDFTDRPSLTLSIYQGQVMLDNQVVTSSPASISPGEPDEEHTLEVFIEGGQNNIFNEFPGEDIGMKVSAWSTVESPQLTYQILSSDLDFALIDNEGNITASVPDSAAPETTLSLRIRVSEEISELTQEVTASVYVMQKNLVGFGTVSAEGGTVSDDTNSIRVEVPPGVLDEDTKIEIFEGETDDGRRVISFDTDSLKTDSVKVYLPDLSSERETRADSTLSAPSKNVDDLERSVESQIVEDYLNWDLQAITSGLKNSTWYMKLAFSWDPRDMSFNPYNFYYRVPSERISPDGGSIKIPINEFKKLKFEARQTFRLLSTYTDRSSLLENDYVPVLFIHGYQRLGEFGGGHKYWGNFPYLMDQLEINGKRIKSFDFHWRSDSRFQDAASDLAKTIKSLSLLTANKKIHIIAHSFGGVLARCFLQGLYLDSDNDRLADYVASLISFGSPYSGVFNKETWKNNLLFPDGQDSSLIQYARNMTVYQMGEEVDYGRMKKYLSLDDSPGEIAYELADKIERIPSDFPMTIGISTIGFSYFPYPYIKFSEGDGLISFKGQRFFPTLSINPLLSVASGNNEINGYPFNINEIFLGFNNDTVPDSFKLIEIWDVTDLSEDKIPTNYDLYHYLIDILNYKHSTSKLMSYGDFANNVQTYITCNSINNCTHEAFIQTKKHLKVTRDVFIIFLSNRDENWEIYAVDSNLDNLTNLTNNPAADILPDISPDRDQIAFVSDRSGNNEIYIMNTDGGGGAIRLTNNTADDGGPKWSPDGKQIAFVSDRDNNYEIYIMDLNGNDDDPIHIMRLTNNPSSDIFPSWSPDGKQIAFVSDRTGNNEIYIMNTDDGDAEPISLTSNSSDNTLPSFSPDGRWIGFLSDMDDDYDLFIIDINGGLPINLTPSDNDQVGHYDWSPDGTQIAFDSRMDGDYEIYILDADGTNLRKLTDNSVSDRFASWTWDGKKIVCVSDRDGNDEVYVIDIDRKTSTNISNDPSDETLPVYSPVYEEGGGCFIATAAFGSYLDPHVKVLRDFRDHCLLTNFIGKALVSFYYNVSPPVADYIKNHDILRSAVRYTLTPVIFGIKYPLEVTCILILIFSMAYIRRNKSSFQRRYFM